MSMLKGILSGNDEQVDNLAEVRKMRLHLAAWLRQRLEKLAQGEGTDISTTAASDFSGSSDLGGGEDIWG